ncbi:MAG: hypothetical protein HOA21_15815 [Rhodospirillaceae bacterium]|nr:hypothetical protein [Rhodospirillaceae bacterium]
MPAKIAGSDALDASPALERKAKTLGNRLMSAAAGAAAGGERAAVNQAADATIDFLLPGVGSEAPGWLQRTEFEWSLREDNNPDCATTIPILDADRYRVHADQCFEEPPVW